MCIDGERFDAPPNKNFLTWFSIAFSIKAIENNVRVIVVSPGNFSTPMGNLEEDDAKKYIDESVLKRNGDPKEIAYLFKSLIVLNYSLFLFNNHNWYQ